MESGVASGHPWSSRCSRWWTGTLRIDRSWTSSMESTTRTRKAQQDKPHEVNACCCGGLTNEENGALFLVLRVGLLVAFFFFPSLLFSHIQFVRFGPL